MGPADQAAIPACDASRALHPALAAFPSPASAGGSLESPTLSRFFGSDRPLPSWGFQRGLAEVAQPVAPVPSEVKVEPLLTPPSDLSMRTNMDLLVGGALVPVHIPESRLQTPLKAGPGLRLPSFEALGIAAPHPDRFGQLDQNDAAAGAREDLIEPLHGVGFASANPGDMSVQVGVLPSASSKLAGRAIQSPLTQRIITLTPPAEAGNLSWSLPNEVPAAPPGSRIVPIQAGSDGVTPGSEQAGVGTSADQATGGIGGGPEEDGREWYGDAVHVLLANLRAAQPSNPLRILSHALPSPSSSGHIYPAVIGAIHNSTPTTPTVWINVFHAIPGRFNLADLPASPPNTPGPPIGGEDYFTQKVFDSAVPISDYQEDLSALPRSPRPVVPPSSINISVVERYIPPANPNEFREMFNPFGPSILVDRIVELSPHNGSLVFIYPTQAGGQTFMREYLSPILDPILRSIVVVHGLSTELGRMVGTMVAVDRLSDHETLKSSIETLCSKLSQRSSGLERFHGVNATFTLSYAAQKAVMLEREVWAKDWWTKQEKLRIRDVVTRFAQEAQKSRLNEHVERPAAPAELIQQLLDGVLKKPYQDGQEPRSGVEVGIFVITRSQ